MTTVTLKINERSNAGKLMTKFLEFISDQPGVEIVEEKSPYNPEFVKKINKSRSSKNLHVFPTDKLWESI